jgi:hypothetical protein
MPDFRGFVGPSYEAANPLQDLQRLVNWFVEVDRTQEAKSPVALLGCPGLIAVNAAYPGEVRGAWVLPGGALSLWVVGTAAILLNTSFVATKIGTLSTSTGQVSIRDNGSGNIAVITDGANGYVYSIKTAVFHRIADPAWLGADKIVFIDGWLGFNWPGTQTFYVAPLYWNGTTPIDGTYFALKDSSSDNIVTHIENNREWWLIGERTTEIWYDAGGTNFPFARLQGATLQIGCAAKNTVCKTGLGLLWLAKSERGESFVAQIQGYSYAPVTTPAVANAIASYAVTSDAHAYTYTEAGHEFYVLTFPTADVTWVYDLTTQIWHQRASTDPKTGLQHRARMNCIIDFAGFRLVGDYTNGKIYKLTRNAFTDDGDPLVCIRRTPHVWDKSDRYRMSHSRLQIEFLPGAGLPAGQGVNPQAMLRWSNDGGFTWGNEHWTSLGAIGNTLTRAIWRRLGIARDRVYELRYSDPTPRDIVGASIITEQTEA